MRAILQRCLEASVTVDGEVVSRIGPGLLVFLGSSEYLSLVAAFDTGVD